MKKIYLLMFLFVSLMIFSGCEETNDVCGVIGHDFIETITPPTCTEKGFTTFECKDCDHVHIGAYVEALGHDLTIYEEVKPTCEENGLSEGFKCNRCDFEKPQEIIPSLGHSYIESVIYPTCESIGYTIFSCECGDSYTDLYVDALGHNIIEVDELKATCELDGHTKGQKCTRCSNIDSTEVIPALGHEIIIDEKVEPTCETTGLTQGEHCTRCDHKVSQEVIPAFGHDIVIDEKVEPTCKTSGLTQGEHCTRCEYKVSQEVIPALGHKIIIDEKVEPTCTTTGLTQGEHCTRCDHKVAQEVIPALKHEIVIDDRIEPTCTTTGLTQGEHCTRCDYKVAQEVIPALGHDIVIDEKLEPTCETTGLTQGEHCTRCDYKVAQEEVPAIGHEYSDWIIVSSPTCDNEGKDEKSCINCGNIIERDTRISGIVNKVLVSNPVNKDYFAGKTLLTIGDSITCGVGLNDKTNEYYGKLVADALGMNVINKGISGSVYCYGGNATTNNTLTARNIKNADVITIFLGINDFNHACKNGHAYGNPNYTSSDRTYYQVGEYGTTDTSTLYGALKVWCENIEQLKSIEGYEDKQFVIITPLISSWNASIGPRSWDQGKTNIHGHTLREYCTAIMRVYAEYGIPVFDANMLSGIYYNSASDNNAVATGGDGVHINAEGHKILANSLIEFLLEGYSYEYRESISNVHQYDKTIVDPTCTLDGYTKHTCSICYDVYKTDFVNALGHEIVIDEKVEPTCETSGLTQGEHCTRCDYKVSQEVIPALGHDIVTDEKVEPTCVNTGLTEGSHCSTCNKVFVEQISIPIVEHNYVNGVCILCNKEKMPYQRLTYFNVYVEINDKQYKDNAVLYLPANYTPTGEPSKLIIFCKQGISKITSNSNPIEQVGFYNYLLTLGYAILGVDGVPDEWKKEIGICERVVGNPYAAKATETAYHYVIDNYNLDDKGCFISGYSQGGHYAQNVIDLTDIPILAAAEQSPVCSMRYHQWDLTENVTINGVKFTKGARINLARIYGFPAVKTNSELLNLKYDENLLSEYDPWIRNTTNVYNGFVQKSNLWYLPTDFDLNSLTMTKEVKCPVKIWCSEDDGEISADVMKVFVKAIQNTGGHAEISIAQKGGHGYFKNQTPVGYFYENGKKYNTLPIAVETAEWFAKFGGYTCKHSYSETIVEPTCVAQGYTNYTCIICGHTYKDNYVDSIDHNFIEDKCINCDIERYRLTNIDLIKHQGGINSEDGSIITSFTNNWYTILEIPEGASQVNFLEFKTNACYGIAFYDNEKFILGSCNNLEGGNRKTIEIPSNAKYLYYGYVYDEIAQDNGYQIFDYIEFLGDSITIPEEDEYLDLPKSQVLSFSVSVDLSAISNLEYSYGTDYGYIMLPKNYTKDGEATRLVIVCHGAGATIDTYKSNATKSTNYTYLTNLGFAVMDMYACPTVVSKDNRGLHYGNPVTLECYKAGYEYVMNHFNLAKDGIFVLGASMGGLSSFQIVQSGYFPVLAQVGYCPAVDIFKQAYCNPWNGATYQRGRIANYFNFDGTTTFTSSKFPSDAEIEYYKQNFNNTVNYSPITNCIVSGDPLDIFKFIPKSAVGLYDEEEQIYDNFIATHNAPLLVFHNLDDGTVSYRYSKYIVDMINRGSGGASLYTFETGAHNAWANGNTYTVVDIDGNNLTIKESQYQTYLYLLHHLPNNDHKLIDKVIESTCTSEGYTLHECEKCEYSFTDSYQDLEAHSYQSGYCIDCNIAHPNLESFDGKVISIFGDSISTFAGYIPVADGFNLEHLARYPQDNLLTDVNDTWWMQIINTFDAKLGINDSWRGATVSGDKPVTTGTSGENASFANLVRIKNLGANGKPDVILFYGGTNDLAHVSKVGTFDENSAPTIVDLETIKWDNLADAYVQTLLRLKYYYPDTQIICLLPTYTSSYYSNTKLANANEILTNICEFYEVPYVDLRYCGISVNDLPDGIHPNANGMDYITNATIKCLLENCTLDIGENVVYSVKHNLVNGDAELHYYKGVSKDTSFKEYVDGYDVTVLMNGVDITDECYKDGYIKIETVTGDIEITVIDVFDADGHLQELPQEICSGTNIWNILEPENIYYTINGWRITSSTSEVHSVTFQVTPGDRIWATSFQKCPQNGNLSSSTSAIRIAWFDELGNAISISPNDVYSEFENFGYIIVPDGITTVSIPMWNNNDDNEIYILNKEHIYEDLVCTSCGYEIPFTVMNVQYDDHINVSNKEVSFVDTDNTILTLNDDYLVATNIGQTKVYIDNELYLFVVDKAKINLVTIMGQSNAGNHFENSTSDITCPIGTAYWWGNGQGINAKEPVDYTIPSMGFHTPLLAELYAQSVADDNPIKNVLIWQEGITSKNGKSITAWASSTTNTSGTNATATMISNCVKYYTDNSDKFEIVGNGIYWLQGESDVTMNPEVYTSLFMAMWSKLKNAGAEYVAFLRVRKGTTYNEVGSAHKDLDYHGSLTAQLKMINDNSDMFLATSITENWIGESDAVHSVNINEYLTMIDTYGINTTFTDNYNNDASITDGVLTTTMKTLYGSNNRCHYGKFGAAIIGCDAAKNMYNALYKSKFEILMADASGSVQNQKILDLENNNELALSELTSNLAFRANCGSCKGILEIKVYDGEIEITDQVISKDLNTYGTVDIVQLRNYLNINIHLNYYINNNLNESVNVTIINDLL